MHRSMSIASEDKVKTFSTFRQEVSSAWLAAIGKVRAQQTC